MNQQLQVITKRVIALAVLAWSLGTAPAAERYVSTALKPPPLHREFRGVWVASVKNIDWPSKPGLSVEQQKSELIALLERAKQLRLNAVLLHIRPSCDALYASTLEPWSEYLTGQMGRPPVPFYDPLAYAVEEAHRRGLELHAWFNPYRARHNAAFSPVSNRHISKTRPHLVRTYGKSLWLDPGEREVQEHSLNVVLDVVKRYDIDGVHFDDYFYPYPEKDARGAVLPFPDWSSWKRYRDGGGRLEREEWRRENVNLFIVRVSQAVKAAKPWVRFGISPFGIWRPGFPAQVRGLDAYDALYADSRKWLREGWVDYMAPQLYWGEERKETSFGALLGWWYSENVHHRHLWPGLDISRVGRTRQPEEIAGQVQATRERAAADGNIHWGVRALTENRLGLADAFAGRIYDRVALTPSFPWLDNTPPARGDLAAVVRGEGIRIRVAPATNSEPVRFWLIQTRNRSGWTAELTAGGPREQAFDLKDRPDLVSVSPVDRAGNVGNAAVLALQAAGPVR